MGFTFPLSMTYTASVPVGSKSPPLPTFTPESDT